MSIDSGGNARVSVRGMCVFGLAYLLTAHSVARAAPDCFANPDCSALAAQGKAAHNEKRYAEALRLYLSAYERVADPRLLILRGRSFFKQGQPERALDLYRAALPQLRDEAERRDAEAFVRQAEAAVQVQMRSSQAPTPSASQKLRLGAHSVDLARSDSGAYASTGTALGASSASQPPLYKRWWFWTLVSVAAAGVATGIGVGIAAREPDTTGLMEYRP